MISGALAVRVGFVVAVGFGGDALVVHAFVVKEHMVHAGSSLGVPSRLFFRRSLINHDKPYRCVAPNSCLFAGTRLHSRDTATSTGV